MTDPYAVPSGTPAPLPQPPAPPLYGDPVAARPRNGLGTTALILGILSIFPFTLLFVPAILAIVFGVVGRRRATRGEATNPGIALAGLICGGVGLVVGGAMVAVIVWVAQQPATSSYQHCVNNAVTQEQKDACARDLSNNLLGH